MTEVTKQTGVQIVMDPVHVDCYTGTAASHEIYAAAVYGEPGLDPRGIQDAVLLFTVLDMIIDLIL